MAYDYYRGTPGVDGILLDSLHNWRIEALTGNDVIESGGKDDVIIAGPETPVAGVSDNDLVYGDTKRGEAGNDEILGGYGDDTLYGDSLEGGGGGNDIIYGGLGNDTLVGGDGNDVLRGGDDNDVIAGGNGDDHLNGESGSNQLFGGSGNDIYYIQNATTSVFEAAGEGIDGVRSIVSYTLTAEVEALALDGFSAINGTGNGLNNSIHGNVANNSISGGGGNDYLAGLGGNDIITGGSGQDGFLITAPHQGIDTIKDFSVVDDNFCIERTGFGAGLAAGFITTDQFRIGSSAQDGSDRFIYNKGTGAVYFDADGIGGTSQIQIAKISTGLSLTNQDFFVVG
jgi:Ca2+-binding RTX toxin-like protein